MKRGFTLLEVMIALALLGLALVVLIKSAAGSIFNAEEAHMMGVATDLARARMYEEQETLIKDGFSDTDTTSPEQCTGTGDDGFKPCDPELWQDVVCCVNVQQIELPSMDVLQQMVMGKAQAMAAAGSAAAAAAAAGSGSGSAGDLAGSGWSADQVNAFKNSTLGGMLAATGILGGDGGTGVLGAQGGMFIQMFYEQIVQILKVSIRKVTLTVRWKVLGHDRDMKVVAFFTDPAAMDQVLQGFGAAAQPATGTGLPTTGTGTGTPGMPGTGGPKLPGTGGTPTK